MTVDVGEAAGVGVGVGVPISVAVGAGVMVGVAVGVAVEVGVGRVSMRRTTKAETMGFRLPPPFSKRMFNCPSVTAV